MRCRNWGFDALHQHKCRFDFCGEMQNYIGCLYNIANTALSVSESAVLAILEVHKPSGHFLYEM